MPFWTRTAQSHPFVQGFVSLLIVAALNLALHALPLEDAPGNGEGIAPFDPAGFLLTGIAYAAGFLISRFGLGYRTKNILIAYAIAIGLAGLAVLAIVYWVISAGGI